MSGELDLAGPHWRFSLAVYGKPGVAPACVLLQDRCGVDVNVLLLGLYAEMRCGAAMTPAQIAVLDNAAREIRETVVAPLRTVRRYMKDAGWGTEAEKVRTQVKAAELMAEQLEQAMLAARLPAAGTAQSAPDALALVHAVVAHFSPELRPGDPIDADTRAAIEMIAAASHAAALEG